MISLALALLWWILTTFVAVLNPNPPLNIAGYNPPPVSVPVRAPLHHSLLHR
jgi:hypothetical protein